MKIIYYEGARVVERSNVLLFDLPCWLGGPQFKSRHCQNLFGFSYFLLFGLPCPMLETEMLLVKLIGINKGRRVTFEIL